MSTDSFAPRRLASCRLACLLLAALLGLAPATRTQAIETSEESPEEVVVTGQREVAPRRLQPETVLSAEQLRRRTESSLGATLDEELGVHNASFGPGVGQPVIRGLSGPRVKIALGGLGNHDAASVSPDHAITLEPLLAEQIRVVRGPAAIRYGSGAVGGVVEVEDGRIPQAVAEQPIKGAFEARYDSNGTRHAQVFKVDAGHRHVAGHLDGFQRNADNLAIPGDALDRGAVRASFGDTAGFRNTRGKLLNADADARGGSAGLSYIDERFLLGAAVNRYENNYGIPPGGLPPHSHTPGVAPGVQRIRLDLEQTRYDLDARWRAPLLFIDNLRVRVGYTDYAHSEIDGDRVSTLFTNEVLETRVELEHALRTWAPGTFGLQWQDRDFAAEGFESFVPASRIESHAAYLTQALDATRARLEFGARIEGSETRPEDGERSIGGAVVVKLPARLSYTAKSGMVALEVPLGSRLALRGSYDHAARAPDVQELLALGPHLSTRSFDVGNIALGLETTRGAGLALEWRTNALEARLNLFRNAIDAFIYQENLGFLYNIEEQQFQIECVRVDVCVPAFGYLQQDALFSGYEAELALPWRWRDIGIRLAAQTDYVRGYFRGDGKGDVPRLPPRTSGFSLRLDGPDWSAGFRATWAGGQRRAGINEAPTTGYCALSADASYTLGRHFGVQSEVFLRARNLLDDEIRNSTSFLRAFMPEAGRSVELGLRMSL